MKADFTHLPEEEEKIEEGIAFLRSLFGSLKIKRPKVEKNPPYQHIYIRTKELECGSAVKK